MAESVYDWLRGTTEDEFSIGKNGPQIQRSGAVALELRDPTNTAFVNGRGADAIIADDFTTLRQLTASEVAAAAALAAAVTTLEAEIAAAGEGNLAMMVALRMGMFRM